MSEVAAQEYSIHYHLLKLPSDYKVVDVAGKYVVAVYDNKEIVFMGEGVASLGGCLAAIVRPGRDRVTGDKTLDPDDWTAFIGAMETVLEAQGVPDIVLPPRG